MNRSTLIAASTILAAAATLFAQQPAAAPAAAPHPVTNLKVLPKDITHEQLHAIMDEWSTDLGVHCNACHAEDPKNLGPNGKPKLNFADDSKDEKQAARVMYLMTQEANQKYLSQIDNSGAPITCGTCHRGHLGPEPFNGDEPKKPASH